jgi:hypothetical protein
VPSRDPHSLSQAIGRLLQDRELADRLAAAAQSAACRSNPEAYTRSLLEIYESVLEGGKLGAREALVSPAPDDSDG